MNPGTRIGPYEITGSLGAGGMGEVYRARDTRLDRDVAVKSLPMGFDADPDRVARFEREAKTLASLNHTNIAQVYGLEHGDSTVIVMELVEGEDLAERLERGALPLDEALPIARQIAEGLAAAHEAGIIHRDLKPANVKVRPDGTVKVLDFGLAKADPASPSAISGATQSPTLLSPAISQAGVILGTAAYMSPEQAKGRAVDRRADIFAFGCVLLELLTGRRAFEGDDITEVLAAVIKDTPPLDAVPAETPSSIHRLLRRCLEKDPRARLDSMRAAVLEIDEATGAAGGEAAAPGSAATPWRRVALALAAGLALAALAIGYMALRGATAPEAPLTQLDVRMEDGEWNLSPDGQVLINSGRRSVRMRRLAEAEWRTLFESSAVGSLVWAPDSRRFAFREGAALKIGDTAGSPPRTVCDSCLDGQVRGLSWNGAGTVLVGRAGGGYGIDAIDTESGEVRSLLVPDRGRGESSYRWPWFLPDGHRFLFTMRVDSGDHMILMGALDGGTPRPLVAAFSTSAWAAGYLLFARDSRLYAQRMDPDSGTVSGDPLVLVPEIYTLPAIGRAGFNVAGARALLYARPWNGGVPTWLDRQGRALGTIELPWKNRLGIMRVSGGRVALMVSDDALGSTDVYVFDPATGARTRVSDDPNWDQHPAWTADGGGIVYLSQRRERPGIYLQPLDGGPERFLLSLRANWLEVSPAGGDLLIETDDGIERASIDAPTEPELWEPGGLRPAFSPDGRHVAYVSLASGSPQLYVRPLEGEGRHRVATSCAAGLARWSHDGREIYFVCDSEMFALPAEDAASLRFGTPEPLFSVAAAGVRLNGFDIDERGRFLLRLSTADDSENVAGLILNWPRLLEQQR